MRCAKNLTTLNCGEKYLWTKGVSTEMTTPSQLQGLATRVDRNLMRAVKVRAAQDQMTLQAVFHQALTDWLKSPDRRRQR